MLRVFISLIFFILISACGSESNSNNPELGDTEKINVDTPLDDRPVFKISGSVVGLNGGMKVKLNDQVININNEEGFEFSVKEGEEFHMEIFDYPKNQRCNVSTIDYVAVSDISNIDVVCENRVSIENALLDVTDANFLACIKDKNKLYIDQFRRLNCNDMSIENIDGIENFTDLIFLILKGNKLSEVDVSGNEKLGYLVLQDNKLTNIDVSHNVNLKHLIVSGNKLGELDVSNNKELSLLIAKDSSLLSINLHSNTNLTYLDVSDNQLKNIDLSKNTKLAKVYLDKNHLVNLDASHNIELTHLYAAKNDLTGLDISKNKNLIWLNLNDNELANVSLVGSETLRHIKIERNKLENVPVGLLDIMVKEAWISLIDNNFTENAQAELKSLKETYINLSY